jgi:hypothetical protein
MLLCSVPLVYMGTWGRLKTLQIGTYCCEHAVVCRSRVPHLHIILVPEAYGVLEEVAPE